MEIYVLISQTKRNDLFEIVGVYEEEGLAKYDLSGYQQEGCKGYIEQHTLILKEKEKQK